MQNSCGTTLVSGKKRAVGGPSQKPEPIIVQFVVRRGHVIVSRSIFRWLRSSIGSEICQHVLWIARDRVNAPVCDFCVSYLRVVRRVEPPLAVLRFGECQRPVCDAIDTHCDSIFGIVHDGRSVLVPAG